MNVFRRRRLRCKPGTPDAGNVKTKDIFQKKVSKYSKMAPFFMRGATFLFAFQKQLLRRRRVHRRYLRFMRRFFAFPAQAAGQQQE